jgi:hypothetical protein
MLRGTRHLAVTRLNETGKCIHSAKMQYPAVAGTLVRK